MKIERVVKPLHYKFSVGELQIRAAKFEDEHVVFDVFDAGGLKVGEFTASDIDGDGNIEYTDKGQYNDTVELLRQTGEGSKIAKNVKATLKSLDS